MFFRVYGFENNNNNEENMRLHFFHQKLYSCEDQKDQFKKFMSDLYENKFT